MNRMRKLSILLLVLLIIVPIVSAQTIDYVFQQGEEVNIKRGCFNEGAYCSASSACNSTLTGPNSAVLIDNIQETNQGAYHNFTIPGSNLSQVGDYLVSRSCIDGVEAGAESYNFRVTVSGFDRINTGESVSFVTGLIVILALAGILFFLFFKSENVAIKMAFLSGSVILIFLSILFIGVIFQQNLAGFSSVVTGYENFVYIIGIMMVIGFIAFALFMMVFIFSAVTRAWKVRRGILDRD